MSGATLERVADAFIVGSLESFNAHDRGPGDFDLASWSSLQQVIDNVNDHNELMLEAIETAAPELRAFIQELLGDAGHYDLWTAIVNACFAEVKRKLEGAT